MTGHDMLDYQFSYSKLNLEFTSRKGNKKTTKTNKIKKLDKF